MLILDPEKFDNAELHSGLGSKDVVVENGKTLHSVRGLIAECMDHRWKEAKAIDTTPIKLYGIKQLYFGPPVDRDDRAKRLTKYGSDLYNKHYKFFKAIDALDTSLSKGYISPNEVKSRILEEIKKDVDSFGMPNICLKSLAEDENENE